MLMTQQVHNRFVGGHLLFGNDCSVAHLLKLERIPVGLSIGGIKARCYEKF
jgi:hypothetical protein